MAVKNIFSNECDKYHFEVNNVSITKRRNVISLVCIRLLLVRPRWRSEIGVRTKLRGFLKIIFLQLAQVIFYIKQIGVENSLVIHQ